MKILVALTIIVIFSSPSLARKRHRCYEVDHPPAKTSTTARPPTPVCQANSTYTDCGTSCPKTCKNKDMMIKCIALCKVGCQCNDGYVLNDLGKCILPKECPPPKPTCPKNQVYSECGANGCQNTCDDPTFSTRCRPICTPGCACKEGYLRDASGNCIPPSSCPVIDTTPTPAACPFAHESYTDCGTACPLTCDNKDNPPIFCTANCVPGCFCDDGYVRGPNGDCILPAACPVKQTCRTNEIYDECRANICQNTCEWPTLGLTCKAPCRAGCACLEGYLRDASGNCVLPSSCPTTDPTTTVADSTTPATTTQPACPTNEIYSLCDANSCQRSCIWLTQPLACRPICTPGCVCLEGLIRDDETGACIPPSSCPVIDTTPTPATCLFAHESYTDCGTACPLTCDNKDNPPAFCTFNCVEGCFCDDGYVRGPNGDCILPAACPATQPACPTNEIYSLCDANSCQRSCRWLLGGLACRPTCTPGCVCLEGLIRDDVTGTCIPPSSCAIQPTESTEPITDPITTTTAPQPTCPTNEVYSVCNYNCQNTCDNPIASSSCSSCVPGCVCADGFVRDGLGICVVPAFCFPEYSTDP